MLGDAGDAQLEYKVILETDMYVCVNRNSLLARQAQLRPEDLQDQTVAGYQGSMIDWFNQYFQGNGALRYSIIATNLESIKREVSRGAAISILSELTIVHHGFLANGEIIAVPLVSGDRAIRLQVALVKLRRTSLSKTAKRLLRVLEELVAQRKAGVAATSYARSKGTAS